MQTVFSRAGRGLAPDFLSCHWSIRVSLRGLSKMIGQQAVWTPLLPPLGVADVRYVTIVGERES